MHGLVNRSLQSFLRDTYGPGLWSAVAQAAGVGPDGFEAMLSYEDALTEALLAGAAARLGKPREVLLEDLGSYLVSLEPLRRLLRFGGGSYADFLQSLEELPGRAHLAVPELALPALWLSARQEGRLRLQLRPGIATDCNGECGGPCVALCAAGRGAVLAWGPVFAGILRAMADDYGALALIELEEGAEGLPEIAVELLDADFAEGRRFELAPPEPPAAGRLAAAAAQGGALAQPQAPQQAAGG